MGRLGITCKPHPHSIFSGDPSGCGLCRRQYHTVTLSPNEASLIHQISKTKGKMQIRQDYLKTFRESIVERMKGMGLAKLPILVHSEILFQANFKSHYLVPKGQAQR